MESEIPDMSNLKEVFNNLLDKFLGRDNIEKKITNNFNNQEIEEICIEIFSNHKFTNQVINNDVSIDLELFEGLGQDKTNTIFSYLNRTYTKTGCYLLKKVLGNPIDDTVLLQKRQNIIKNFVKNPELTKTIQDKLVSIAKVEDELLWFWRKLNDETRYLFDMVYFKNKYLNFLNTNELAMRIYNYYVIIFSPLYGIISPIIMVLAPYILIKFYFKTEVSFNLYFKILKKALTGISKVLKMNIEAEKASALDMSWTTMISMLVWLVFYIHGLFSNINNAKNVNKITNIMHTRINNISKLVKSGHSIYDLLGEDIESSSLYLDVKVKKHFNILWDDLFTKEPNFHSNKGLILKTYKILDEKKDSLLDMIKYISNIDCLISIAKLVTDNSTLEYTFPEYIFKQNHPSIEARELVYPILKGKVVSNNIKIGLTNPQNVILTGPNAGGKSTFIKTLCLSVILGQTLTIVPAKFFQFTPFSLVSTYLNIPDSKGKESLFEAEMRRSLQYINTIKTLDKKKFSFVIMDEIFSSTNPEEGIAGAYAIANNISKNTNNITILTTHYSYLSKLEKTGKFKNYKIPINRDSNNNIEYTYKIEPGVSHQYIALELLQNKGFDKEIVSEALSVCQQLNMKNQLPDMISQDRKKKVKRRSHKATELTKNNKKKELITKPNDTKKELTKETNKELTKETKPNDTNKELTKETKPNDTKKELTKE